MDWPRHSGTTTAKKRLNCMQWMRSRGWCGNVNEKCSILTLQPNIVCQVRAGDKRKINYCELKSENPKSASAFKLLVSHAFTKQTNSIRPDRSLRRNSARSKINRWKSTRKRTSQTTSTTYLMTNTQHNTPKTNIHTTFQSEKIQSISCPLSMPSGYLAMPPTRCTHMCLCVCINRTNNMNRIFRRNIPSLGFIHFIWRNVWTTNLHPCPASAILSLRQTFILLVKLHKWENTIR